VLVVADGMGGHPAGEVASQIAVDTVLTHLAPPDRPAAAERPRLPGLLDAVLAAHAAVLAAAARRPDWRGMGTALAVARVCGPRLETCHVGDVRVYLARRGQFLQLTQDHSLAIQLLHAGQLTPAQARGDRSRHRLSQALGGAHPLQPECHAEALQDRDLVLLCSDGLWEAMDDTALAGILAAPDDLSSRLAALVEAANTAGGRDNITAVLYQHQPRSGDP
jgi:protein phosphatase